MQCLTLVQIKFYLTVIVACSAEILFVERIVLFYIMCEKRYLHLRTPSLRLRLSQVRLVVGGQTKIGRAKQKNLPFKGVKNVNVK